MLGAFHYPWLHAGPVLALHMLAVRGPVFGPHLPLVASAEGGCARKCSAFRFRGTCHTSFLASLAHD